VVPITSTIIASRCVMVGQRRNSRVEIPKRIGLKKGFPARDFFVGQHKLNE